MPYPVALHLIRRVLVSVIVASCFTPAAPLAQTPLADPESYTRTKSAATQVFLDSKRSKEERLAATKNLGYLDEGTLPALLAIGADQREDNAIRWEALRRHRYGDRYLQVVLKILADPNDGSEELDTNLIEDLSRRTTSVPPAPVRQRIQAVLRKLLDDKRDRVRLYAYRALIANHDQVAVNVLAESLRRGRDFPIPVAEAIDLLNENGPVNHITAIRPYLANPDARIQAKAAQALAVDPQSRPRIVELAKNPETPTQTRLFALRALAREDGQFVSYAIPLVEDKKTDPKIRDAAMHAIVGRMNYSDVSAADQLRFAKAVENMAVEKDLKSGDALKAKETAEQLHPYLRKTFPEIQKYYENR